MPPKAATAPAPTAEDLARILADPAIQKFRAIAMEQLPDTGPLRVEASGVVVLELTDLVLRFSCPTLGQYRELVAFAEALAKDEGPDLVEDSTVAWWRRAAELLADGTLPEEAALPVWLANAAYPRQTENTWAMRPTPAPGT